jgi:hypothetical protein
MRILNQYMIAIYAGTLFGGVVLSRVKVEDEQILQTVSKYLENYFGEFTFLASMHSRINQEANDITIEQYGETRHIYVYVFFYIYVCCLLIV